MAAMLGLRSAPQVADRIWRLGKRVAEYLETEVPQWRSGSPGWWQVIANFIEEPGAARWELREVASGALAKLELLSDLEARAFPDAVDPSGLFEGAVRQVTVNAYERSIGARAACIAHYGAKCQVCGFDFDFEEAYGEIGRGYIHVHHRVPLSEIGQEYQVDPVRDLIPVCPNCHAMLHAGGELRTVVELRDMIRDRAV